MDRQYDRREPAVSGLLSPPPPAAPAVARLRSLRATKGSEGSPHGSGSLQDGERGRWSRSDEVGDLLFGVPGRPKTSQIGSPERFRDYFRVGQSTGAQQPGDPTVGRGMKGRTPAEVFKAGIPRSAPQTLSQEGGQAHSVET